MTVPLQSRYVYARDELDVLCDAAFAWLDDAEPGACVELFEGPTTYERESGSLDAEGERPRRKCDTIDGVPDEDREGEACERFRGLAMHFVRRSGLEHADALQAAMIGIVRAVRRFDETRGLALHNYAAWWIRHELSDARAHAGIIKLNKHAVQARRRWRKVSHELASVEEIAAAAEVSVSRVRAFEELGDMQTVSVWDELDGDGEGEPLETSLAGASLAADARVKVADSVAVLRAALARLKKAYPRLHLVVERRLRGATVREIGAELGVTHQRASQLWRDALAYLKATIDELTA